MNEEQMKKFFFSNPSQAIGLLKKAGVDTQQAQKS